MSQIQVRSSGLSLQPKGFLDTLTPQLSWTSPSGALTLLTGVGWLPANMLPQGTSTSPRSSSSAHLLFYHSLEISLHCLCYSQGTMKPLFKGRHSEDIHSPAMWKNGCKLHRGRVWLFTGTFKTMGRREMNEGNWRTLSILGLYFLSEWGRLLGRFHRVLTQLYLGLERSQLSIVQVHISSDLMEIHTLWTRLFYQLNLVMGLWKKRP